MTTVVSALGATTKECYAALHSPVAYVQVKWLSDASSARCARYVSTIRVQKSTCPRTAKLHRPKPMTSRAVLAPHERMGSGVLV